MCQRTNASARIAEEGSASCRRIRIVASVGWGLVLVFVLWAALLGSVAANARAFQLAYFVGFAGYLAVLWAVCRRASDEGGSHQAAVAPCGRWGWWLAACLIVRLVPLAMEPGDDVYRYAWEGRVQLAGFSPFVSAPNDPTLVKLRDSCWSKINHPDYPAIYPPVAQLEFLAVAAVDRFLNGGACHSVHLIKILHTLWDLMVVVLLGACLRRSGRPPHGAVVYGLCPLVLTAFAIEGHVDSLMLLFAALASWAVLAKRSALAGAALGLAVATKLVFVVLAPWFVKRHPRAVIASIVVLILSYLPYAHVGPAMFTGLLRFGASGEFFSLPGTLGIAYYDTHLGHVVGVALLGTIVIVLSFRRREWFDYAHGAVGALLLLIPIVHYWYVSWVLVLLPFRLRMRWIVAALGMASYFDAVHAQALTSRWHMPAWAPTAVWIPFLLVWAVELVLEHYVNPRSGIPVSSPVAAERKSTAQAMRA